MGSLTQRVGGGRGRWSKTRSRGEDSKGLFRIHELAREKPLMSNSCKI